MKLVTVMDNRGGENHGLISEHGLSFYAEFPTLKVLFDFGPGKDTLANARKLDIPLPEIQYAIGSHGHYDHAGGYPAFVDAVECDGFLQLTEDVFLLSGFTQRYPFETIPERFKLRDGDGWRPDCFDDEICLVHQLKDGLFVLVGCSHPGILNILSTVEDWFHQPILGVAGGTHLMEADEARIRKTLDVMKGFGMKFIGFNHCTGERFRQLVTEVPELHAVYLGAGDSLFLE